MRDMTTGSPVKKLLLFTLPLLLGTVFQQFYSMVDSIIVGQYVGTQAFAAVGSTGSITFLVLGLVFGSCSGFAVPVAQEFGAGSMEGVRKCVANIVYICVTICVVLTLLTTIFCRQILEMLDTQPEMLQDAYDYLFFLFLGLGAQMMYNMLSGILRALGDSRTPLVFLIISSLLNVILDLLLVKTLAIGVKGAAIATVVAQLVSGLLCLGYIAKSFPVLHLKKEDMKPDRKTIGRLLGIGIPMGLQFSITAIGAVILQKSVNGLDANAVATVAAAGKVQGLVVAPMDSFGAAVATFVGQNYGAKKIQRVRQGVSRVYMILLIWSGIGFLLNVFASAKIALLFIEPSETVILKQVTTFMTRNGMFYPALALIHVLRNALQGVGYSKAAMIGGLLELVARSVVGMFIVPIFGFAAVCFANPFAWFMADFLLVPLYFYVMPKLQRQFEAAEAAV